MKRLLHLLPLCVLFLMFACEYTPTGEFFKEVDQNPQVAATIDLNGYQDTIRIRGEVTFKYSYSMPGRKILRYKLLFNDQVLREEEAPNISGGGSQHFYSPRYKDGYYLLQLVLVGSAGTGSLADKIGVEGVEVYRSWVVLIDNAPLQPVAVSSVKPVDGRLQVEWQWPKRVGIRSLGVLKLTDTYLRSIGIAESPNVSSMVDDEFVGGTASYRINVYKTDFSASVEGPFYSYHYPLPHIVETSFNEQHQLTVKFTSTPFFRNFSKYHLSSGQGLDFTSTVSTDTVATFRNLVFGQDYTVQLATYQKKFESNMFYKGIATESVIKGYGTPYGSYQVSTLLQNHRAGVLYAFSANGFHVLDAATLQLRQSRSISANQPVVADRPQNAVSEDGRFVYSLLNATIHKLHPATLQTLETYRLTDLLPHSNYTKLSLNGVSNTNRLLLAAEGLQKSDSVFLVDMDQRKVLDKRWISAYGRVASVTADGKIINASDFLFMEQSNGAWREQAKPEGLYYNMQFHPSEPWFYVMHGNIVKFYDVRTATQVKTITLEKELSRYSIDAASGLLYGYAGNTLYLYNSSTGQLRRKIEVIAPGAALPFHDKILTGDRYIPL